LQWPPSATSSPPRERGRYQGYIAATFAGAAALGPLAGGLLVDHASWRWIFYVNVPVGAAALLALRAKLPAAPVERPALPLDGLGAALLAGATAAFILVCVWGGQRYAWGSAQIAGLIGAVVVACRGAGGCASGARQIPIVPLRMLASPVVALSSAGLFLGTGALFAVTVFVPVFLQRAAGLSPTDAGLLLVPMMVGTTISTTLCGRSIARTGRYKHFPIIGLTVMAVSLALLAALVGQRSATATGLCLLVFGLGFGLVSQMLVVAVQNSVERTQLGIATATTTFFRALGGSVGAAGLGAVFAARLSHGDIAQAAQTVFLVAAPLAALAAVVLLWLPQKELQGR